MVSKLRIDPQQQQQTQTQTQTQTQAESLQLDQAEALTEPLFWLGVQEARFCQMSGLGYLVPTSSIALYGCVPR